MIDILNKFLEEGITALPIVDSEGKLTNIYSKFDVFSLESFFDLEIPVSEASKHKIYFEGVYNCKGWCSSIFMRERSTDDCSQGRTLSSQSWRRW